jgi:hypothetical protein
MLKKRKNQRYCRNGSVSYTGVNTVLQDTLLETSSRCAHLISFTGGYSLLSDLEPSLFQTQLTLFQPSALSETLHISC